MSHIEIRGEDEKTYRIKMELYGWATGEIQTLEWTSDQRLVAALVLTQGTMMLIMETHSDMPHDAVMDYLSKAQLILVGTEKEGIGSEDFRRFMEISFKHYMKMGEVVLLRDFMKIMDVTDKDLPRGN